jgi:lysophospholipase L1-like esterase
MNIVTKAALKKRFWIIAVLGIVVVIAAVLVVHFLLAQKDTAVAPTTSTTPSKGSYVALGDSVAAGEGLKDFSDSSACDRTEQSYPKQVATQGGYTLWSVACSGATIANGIQGAQEVNKLQLVPQLEQLYARQAATGKPALVTLTIGANDINWASLLQNCYTSVCGTAADQAQVRSSLRTLDTNLRQVLASLQAHYGAQPPTIVVTGYHQVFPAAPAAGCTDLPGIDTAELAWGRQLQTSLNDTIQSAVKAYPRVEFAAVDFSGHELCSAESWVQGLGDAQPYHPTQAGQAAFAKAVLAAVNSAGKSK